MNMKMSAAVGKFVVEVLMVDNPGLVKDPRLSDQDRPGWTSVWAGWDLERKLLNQVLVNPKVRLSPEERGRLLERLRRLDRLTFAGRRAETPLDPAEALFAEAAWSAIEEPGASTSPSDPAERVVESTTRADSVRRSTGR